MRCNFCNIKGHTIAICRFRQKEEYPNAGNNSNYNTVSCKYCKCAGHTIAVCKKRIWKESQNSGYNTNSGSNSNTNSNSYNNNPRKCFRCGDTTHIAKYCPNNNQKQHF